MRRLSLPLVILLSVVIAACLTGTGAGSNAPNSGTKSRPRRPRLRRSSASRYPAWRTSSWSRTRTGRWSPACPRTPTAKVKIKVQKETLFIKSADGGRWWGNVFGRGPGGTTTAHHHFKDLGEHRRRRRRPDLGAGNSRPGVEHRRLRRHHDSDRRPARDHAVGRRLRRTEGRTRRAGHRPEHLDFRRGQLPGRQAGQRQRQRSMSAAPARSWSTRARSSPPTSPAPGVVEYIGDPVVKESISGAGHIKRRDAATQPFRPSRWPTDVAPVGRSAHADSRAGQCMATGSAGTVVALEQQRQPGRRIAVVMHARNHAHVRDAAFAQEVRQHGDDVRRRSPCG